MEGTYYLLAEMSVPCFEGEHLVHVVFSSLALLLYALGLPAWIVFMLKNGSNIHGSLHFLTGAWRACTMLCGLFPVLWFVAVVGRGWKARTAGLA